MKSSQQQLREVSVTAAKPVIKQEVDRISYDIQADPESKALTVFDMLCKVPLVSMDANDNIMLKGNSSWKEMVINSGLEQKAIHAAFERTKLDKFAKLEPQLQMLECRLHGSGLHL